MSEKNPKNCTTYGSTFEKISISGEFTVAALYMANTHRCTINEFDVDISGSGKAAVLDNCEESEIRNVNIKQSPKK